MYNQARVGGLDLGAYSPWNFLEIRCPEIASDAILGQKQHRSSSVRYMARGVLYPINFWLSMYAFAKPADIKFPREKVLWLTAQQVG